MEAKSQQDNYEDESSELELHWGQTGRALPFRWVYPNGRSLPAPHGPGSEHEKLPISFCERMRRLCQDVSQRCVPLQHIQVEDVLISYTPSRTRSHYGLQARLTPMRCVDGQLTRSIRGQTYQVQRYFVDGREMKYLIAFCLPRFLDQTFREKLITVFHELYHIHPDFNGDLRRHEGRYQIHSHSKREYDQKMADWVELYLKNHPWPEVFEFLRCNTQELWQRWGGIRSAHVPRPKLIPVGQVAVVSRRNKR